MKTKCFFVGLFFCLIFSNGIFSKGGSDPTYYTYDDLIKVAKDNQNNFYYDSSSYSRNGDVAFIPQGPNTDSGSVIAALWKKRTSVASLPKGYKKRKVPNNKNADLKSITVQSFDDDIIWDEYPYIKFNWRAMWAENGDLLFMRSNGKGDGGFGYFIHKFISSWTHVAIIVDKWNGKVIDSLPEDGVAYHYPNDYKKILTYGTKGVWGADATWVLRIADGYKGKKYWPSSCAKGGVAPVNFLFKWLNINDFDSMYCSKFVYKVFKDSNIDLNSHRTHTTVSTLRDSSSNMCGITPDDIWGSDQTTPYKDLVNGSFLSYVL